MLIGGVDGEDRKIKALFVLADECSRAFLCAERELEALGSCGNRDTNDGSPIKLQNLHPEAWCAKTPVRELEKEHQMKKKFTDDQIIGAVKKLEAGAPAKEMTFSSKPIWLAFDHRFRKTLLEFIIHHQSLGEGRPLKLAIALSGGADSVALMFALQRQQAAEKFHLLAMHFHHGDSAESSILKYREESLKWVSDLCERLCVPLRAGRHTGSALLSEAAFREVRWEFFRQIMEEEKADYVVTGHHREDQLETRLIRLMRGCGPVGLRAMTEREEKIWRPFLTLGKNILEKYLKDLSEPFMEDPSNQDTRYLRNWIRRELLVALEKKHPGAMGGLDRSLDIIAKSFEEISSERHFIPSWVQGDPSLGIQRAQFYLLPRFVQRRTLVEYLHFLGVREWRHSQIEEILKHLDTAQIVHTFRVLNLDWRINAQHILVQKPP